MSHFTKLDKAKIIDPDAFIQACADLGFTEVQRDVTIKAWDGKTKKVEIACKMAGEKYEIGLQQNEEGKYDMLADWWGIRLNLPSECKNQGIKTDSDLQDTLLRHTTKHTLTRKYRRQGFRAEISEDAEHNIRVRLSRA